MSKKIQVYLDDENEKLFNQRLVEATISTRRPVGVTELVISHFRFASERPICEVVS